MKILVTGASGFLGREVMARLATTHEMIGLAYQHATDGLLTCDIRDSRALQEVLDQVQPDAVAHLAAYREPDFCEQHPDECERLNVGPTHTLCQYLPPSVRLLFVSTDYVFDGTCPPYVEEDRPDPINRYGASKVASEQRVRARPKATILRVPLLVGGGPTLAESGFIGQMVQAIRCPSPQEVDNVLMRFPTWTRDVADGIDFLLQQDSPGTYHLSGARGATRYAWSETTARTLGLDSGHLAPSNAVIPRAAPRPPNSQLNDSQIHEAGFHPCADFATVVRTVLEELHEI